MALAGSVDRDYPLMVIINCMMDPVIALLKESEILTSIQLKECAARVDAITQMFSSSDLFSRSNEATVKEKDSVLLSTIKDICFPLFYSLHMLPDSTKMNSERRKVLSSIIRCITVALDNFNDESLVCKVVLQTMMPLAHLTNPTQQLIVAMNDPQYHEHRIEKLDALTLLELFQVSFNKQSAMTVLLSNVNKYGTDRDNFLYTFFQILLTSSEMNAVFSKAMNAIVKLLLFLSKNHQDKILQIVWQRFTQTLPLNANGSFDKESLWQSLFVFYSFKDWFFPLEKVEETKRCLALRLQDEFWLIVQAGMLSSEPSHRKMSMYLLKRLVDTCQQHDCVVNAEGRDFTEDEANGKQIDDKRGQSVFWWCPESSCALTGVWEDFVTLMEVLEEKQVHVIKPLLPRVKSVISACSIQCKEGKKVAPLMHSSWLMTLLARSFHHESHFLSRWGSLTLLTIDMKEIPFVRQGQLKFLSSDLISYLQENRLYTRYEGTQSAKSSPVREAVTNFFANLFDALSQAEKVEYLTSVLQKVSDNSWGSIPMVFLFQGLSRIPPQPVLTSRALELIRYIIQACLTTHEVPTRGAIECFICQMLMNLVDLDQVSPSQFFKTVAEMNREESFQRGTVLWNQLVEWLSFDSVRKKWTDEMMLADSMAYLKQDKWKDTEASMVFEGNEVVSLARMLLLFADMIAMRNDPKELKTCPLGLVLSEMSVVLSNIGSRAYVNIKHVDASLALLNCLVKEIESNTAKGPTQCQTKDLVKWSVTSNFENIVSFIINRLSQDLTKAEDLDEIKFYADVISTSGSVCDKIQKPIQDLLKFVGNVFNTTLKADPNSETNSSLEVWTLSAVTILNSIFKMVLASDCVQIQESIWTKILEMPSVHEIPVPFTKRKSGSTMSNLQMGRVISHFVSFKWQCRKFMFEVQTRMKQPYSSLNGLIDDAMDALSMGSGDSDIAVVQTIELVMEQLVLQPCCSEIPQFLKAAWSKLMEERKNALFWLRIESLVPTVLHPSLLKQDRESEIASYIEDFLTDVLEVAESKSGVTYLLMQHLTKVMTDHDQDRVIARWLVDKLIDASVFGDIHEKGKRLLLDIFIYIENLGDQLATNQITSSASKNDMNTRIILISWLTSLKLSVPADCEFVLELLRSLKEKYLEIARITTYKQFSNSYHHRLKHRMLLVFLSLSEFIQEDDCKEILEDLWQALILECHPSVRHTLEWVVMRLILRFPVFLSSMWEMFSMFTEKRSICLCSLFLILSRIGPKLPKHIQNDFYASAFSRVLPWCLAHHYNTRIFAQACLMRLWEQCQELQLTQLLQTFHLVQSTVDFVFKNGNSSGTVLKLLSNFMFSSFDPIRDFSAETIFHTLPRLASIAEDEWIFPEQLLKQDLSWKTAGTKLFPLLNPSSDLANCEEGPWRMKAQTVNEEDIVETTDGDFQKKIVSWRQMSPDQETETEQITQRRRLKDGGLILVTSLIDKVPNLGGLCRTSEIFGVSEFVIGNLTHLNDHMFQSLSVSAQKWLNITEVPRHHVTKYMEEKKAEGYILVGVEQTANSVPLDKYVFPKNTLLLLGNEKEGIPPDMIQNLDVCVEIPQHGIIRSLNVHVCGALIVWEYTRQCLIQDSG